MPTIYTHSHTFHPDELLAIALLQRTVFKDDPATIVRTRDEAILADARSNPDVFVVDVGFVFDPTHRNFDHHQGELTETWPDGTPYSACGLIWSWLRQENHLGFWPTALQDALEERLVKRADRYDNGVGGAWPEGDFLAGYNRSSSHDPSVADEAFQRALVVAGDFLENTARTLEKEVKAEMAVRKALPHALWPHGILVMADNRSGQYASAAARLSDGALNLVVVPRSSDSWTLITTPADQADPFSRKTPAPEAWRGKERTTVDLPDRSVVLEFCHKNGFLSAVKGTLDDALAVARFVCETAHPDLLKQAWVNPVRTQKP